MTLVRARHLLVMVLTTGVLAFAGVGCGGREVTPPAAGTVAAPPPPCANQPPGLAQDGVNDEQGGSVPGVDPCDGPGN